MSTKARAARPVSDFDTRLRELIRKCQAAAADSDERRAIFEDIYKLTKRTIWRVLWGDGLDEATCEDLMQEVFFDKIYANIDMIEIGPASNPLGWMRKVARNHKIDHLRAAERASFIVAFAEDDDADLYKFDIIDANRERVNDPVVEKAFETLSPKMEFVVDRYYAENNARDEAARLLNWSKKKVKKTVEGLRARLLAYPGLADFWGLDAKGKPLPRRRKGSEDEAD